MNLEKIPATIVTGFLGSGKTTLLSNVVKQANGKRIAVIVNEFGELDIDADILRSCPLDCDEGDSISNETGIAKDGVYELANGCICCTVEEEFLPVMKQLIERRHDIDHILIETSGLALPKPLVQAFNWPEIKQHCTVDSVITVVDGPAVADGRIAHNPDNVEAQRGADESLDHDPSLQELLEDQLSSADMVIISKSDKLDGTSIDKVKSILSNHIDSQVKMLEVENGEINSQLLMGLEFATEDKIESVHTHHDHHHKHEHDHTHAHDHFDSTCIEFGEVDGDAIERTVKKLIQENTIYRVKGFLPLPGKPMRQVFQGVGDRIERYYDRAWQVGEPRSGKLVFIGKDLGIEQLRNTIKSHEITS